MRNSRRKSKPVDIAKLMLEGDEVTKALERGALQAREEHRKLGLPMVIDRDGKPTWVTAEEMDAEDEKERQEQAKSKKRRR
jgi:hypothetical protein